MTSRPTSRASSEPEQPSIPSAPTLRLQLEIIQAELVAQGARVELAHHLPDDALAPKLAAERQRLRAIVNP